MDTESLLKEFLGEDPQRQPEKSEGVAASERFVPMLDFVRADGSRFAMPYSMMVKVEFVPSKAIVVRYSTEDVLIAGYRLEAVYKAISQHRLRQLRETDQKSAAFEKEGSEPAITLIKCQPAS